MKNGPTLHFSGRCNFELSLNELFRGLPVFNFNCKLPRVALWVAYKIDRKKIKYQFCPLLHGLSQCFAKSKSFHSPNPFSGICLHCNSSWLGFLVVSHPRAKGLEASQLQRRSQGGNCCPSHVSALRSGQAISCGGNIDKAFRPRQRDEPRRDRVFPPSRSWFSPFSDWRRSLRLHPISARVGSRGGSRLRPMARHRRAATWETRPL